MRYNIDFVQSGPSDPWVVAKPGYELLGEFLQHELPQTSYGCKYLLKEIDSFEHGTTDYLEKHGNAFTLKFFRNRVELHHWYLTEISPLVLSLQEFKDTLKRCLEFLECGNKNR